MKDLSSNPSEKGKSMTSLKFLFITFTVYHCNFHSSATCPCVLNNITKMTAVTKEFINTQITNRFWTESLLRILSQARTGQRVLLRQ